MSPQLRSEYDEADLIRRAKENDRAAQGQLYERYVDAIYRYLFFRSGNHAVAEDLTSEVFAHMLTSLARYEDRGLPFGAWLFRIARARLVDYWRANKRREMYTTALSEEIEAFAASDDLPVEGQDYQDLLQALDYLTEAEREIILLRFASGLENQDIALAVQSNPNAIKSMMYRALRKLREILIRQEQFYDSSLEEHHN